MSKIYLQSIKLEGIHKRYNLDIKFNKSLNVLHGQNGTGKSTLIHIMANVANCDFVRFAFLEFSKIHVSYSNDTSIVLTQFDDEDNERVVKIETHTGEIFTFFKREAIEDIRETEDERFFNDYKPELTKRISEFVKSNELRYVDTSYFPAFRTMLEAWSSQKEHREHRVHRRKLAISQATTFSRNLFGQFLPTINFPSPIDIENSLREEIREAQIRIARYESSVFSDSFTKVFSALFEENNAEINTENLLAEISALTSASTNSKLGDYEENSNTYRELQRLVSENANSSALASTTANALAVYRDALKARQSYQIKVFEEIDKYFEVVNSFLDKDKKELGYELDKTRRMPKVGLKFPDGTWSSIKVMSSGERQLLTMLYAVNKMSGNSAVLIDEPELSLHIDWQEDLLEKMMEQLGDRQIIVCTHAPSIASDFDDYMKEIIPIFKDSPINESYQDDEEDLF